MWFSSMSVILLKPASSNKKRAAAKLFFNKMIDHPTRYFGTDSDSLNYFWISKKLKLIDVYLLRWIFLALAFIVLSIIFILLISSIYWYKEKLYINNNYINKWHYLSKLFNSKLPRNIFVRFGSPSKNQTDDCKYKCPDISGCHRQVWKHCHAIFCTFPLTNWR